MSPEATRTPEASEPDAAKMPGVFYTLVTADLAMVNPIRLAIKEEFPNAQVNQVLESENGDQTIAVMWYSEGDFEPGITTVLDSIWAIPGVRNTVTHMGVTSRPIALLRRGGDSLVWWRRMRVEPIDDERNVDFVALKNLLTEDEDVFEVAHLLGEFNVLIGFDLDVTSMESIVETMDFIDTSIREAGYRVIALQDDPCP